MKKINLKNLTFMEILGILSFIASVISLVIVFMPSSYSKSLIGKWYLHEVVFTDGKIYKDKETIPLAQEIRKDFNIYEPVFTANENRELITYIQKASMDSKTGEAIIDNITPGKFYYYTSDNHIHVKIAELNKIAKFKYKFNENCIDIFINKNQLKTVKFCRDHI